MYWSSKFYDGKQIEKLNKRYRKRLQSMFLTLECLI
jgi:hypothetical protein